MIFKQNKNLCLSYIALRRLIGVLWLLLPFICMAGGALFGSIGVQRSISFYYHTNMQDFFVGLMFCVGMFLLTYSGHDIRDITVSRVSGTCGVMIAFFPCLAGSGPGLKCGIFQLPANFCNVVHLAAAITFFIALAVNSLFLFTLSDKPKDRRGRSKHIRNAIYIICGTIIIASLLVLLFLYIGMKDLHETKLVLLFETIMLVAFGISWLVKGETLFKDPQKIPAAA
ncbi:MAG: hypothetical protein JW874_00865 [Spirochaetales bacterium]|nr:hypothetical protein [Spirochaetales bacterium]